MLNISEVIWATYWKEGWQKYFRSQNMKVIVVVNIGLSVSPHCFETSLSLSSLSYLQLFIKSICPVILWLRFKRYQLTKLFPLSLSLSKFSNITLITLSNISPKHVFPFSHQNQPRLLSFPRLWYHWKLLPRCIWNIPNKAVQETRLNWIYDY